MASNPKEIMVDVMTNVTPAPIDPDQVARAWAAVEAAKTLRARVMGDAAQFGVSAYEVIMLADWIATGTVPDLAEVEATEYEGETATAETDRSEERHHVPPLEGLEDGVGVVVRHVGETRHANAVNGLFRAYEFGGTNFQSKVNHTHAFLAALGFGVEVQA